MILAPLTNWVAIADRSRPPLWTFAPIVGDLDGERWEVVDGMAVETATAPGELVGFVHSGGSAAVVRWIDIHADDVVALLNP